MPSVCEGAFLYRDVLIRADVLERKPGGWNLVEVKSGTKFKEHVYDSDVAVQLWVLRGAGLSVENTGLLSLNRNYVFEGIAMGLEQLFVRHECTDYVESLQPEVEHNVASFMAMLNVGEPPEMLPGEQCFTPYDCPYYAHCTRDLVFPKHPVIELPRINGASLQRLTADGMNEVPHVPEDFLLTTLQARVRESVITGSEYFSEHLGNALQDVTYPVYYLDFETFMPAIPRYAETRPYEAIPFQYSLHVEHANGQIEHIEYLHETDTNPLEPLTVALISALGESGTICAYSSYEKQVIGALAHSFPHYANHLHAILNRLLDLLPVVRKHYYHPDFHGSFSIKKVLPVLVPDLGYDNLAIQDGQAAGLAYQAAQIEKDAEARQRIFIDLREYCGLDTEAMVRLRGALHKKISRHDSTG